MRTTGILTAMGLAALAAGGTLAAAEWDGAQEMLAAYYNEEMSVPKGWTLSYSGRENGVDVYVFDTDFDTYPQTAFLQADDQLERLMCGDDTIKGWVAQGMRTRADMRALANGKRTLTKGTRIITCG